MPRTDPPGADDAGKGDDVTVTTAGVSSTTGSSGRLYLQFGALATIWGASFLFIKIALDGMSATQVATGRLVLGAATLGVLVVAGRRPLPTGWQVWGRLLVVAVLLCALPFTLFSFAETRISSGLTSIWNATTPLLTLLMALAFLPSERPTRAKLAGLLLGAVGVLVVLEIWTVVVPGPGATGPAGSDGGSADLVGQLACLGATSCYAVAFVVLRRVMAGGFDPLAVAFVHVMLAAVVMLLLAPLVSWTPMTLSLPVLAAILPLGVLGTGLAYLWNARIVRGLGATTASTVTYLTPVVGVLLGVLVLGERPAWHHLVGAVLVVAGIAVGQGRLRRSLSRYGW